MGRRRLSGHPAVIAARVAVPSALLAASAMAVVALVLTAAWRPAALWPLHGAGVALLLGVSAWCADEPLAPLVDVAPRATPWATRLRGAGPILLVAAWAAAHVVRRSALPPHLPVLIGEGAVAALVGHSWASHRRALGEGDAGSLAAMTVVPVLIAVALVRPLADHLPVFPLWPWEPWRRAELLWAALAMGGLVLSARTGAHRRGRSSRAPH